MNKSLKIFSLISFISLSFNGCGGSGGSTSSIKDLINSNNNSANYFQYAWSLNETPDSSFKSTNTINDFAHININPAWQITKGKKSNGEKIKVAIIDQDFDITHPDFFDENGNSKIIGKYNVMTGNENLETNAYDEPLSHGTAVASVIASQNHGVAPDVELILININFGNELDSFKIIEAFQKADELGANVINCSWGADPATFKEGEEVRTVPAVIKTELQRLRDKNVPVIFSSGNGINGTAFNLDTENYESEPELTSVIGVGATSKDNDVTAYSDYGSNIDVLAPGGSDDLGVLVADLQGTKGDNNTNNLVNNNYTFVKGTSFSAPKVTGLTALMLAANPNLTFHNIRRILISKASQVNSGDAAYKSVVVDGVGGLSDEKRAFGKVNAGASVLQAQSEL